MSSTVTKALADVAPITSSSPTGEFDVILSTRSLDRDGDRLHPDQWRLPLPDHITFDSDHGRSVATTVGSGKPFLNRQGEIQVRGSFASTEHAQNVRTLVNEGHIRNVSVAFMESRNQKSGGVERELLNGAFVAVPSNVEAVVLSSKSARIETPLELYTRLKKHAHPGDGEPYGDVEYADPGYRDGKARYPINSADHVRAAWDYINHPKDASEYTSAQLSKVKERIRRAANKYGVKLNAQKDAPHASADHMNMAPLLPPDTDSPYPNIRPIPRDAMGVSDAYEQTIHDLAVTLGARCPGVNAFAGLTDGAPHYGTKDAPHAHADAGGQEGRYLGPLVSPDLDFEERVDTIGSIPRDAVGASDALNPDLQSVHDLAIQLGAACPGDYETHRIPQDATGDSDATEALQGVQRVLMNLVNGPGSSLNQKSPQSAGEPLRPDTRHEHPPLDIGRSHTDESPMRTALGNGLGIGEPATDTPYPHLQMIHDASVQLGGMCDLNMPTLAEAGQVWGANSPVVGQPMYSHHAKGVNSAASRWAQELASGDDERIRAKRLAIALRAKNSR